MKLRERTAIVTGASRGLGKAIATRFIREGAHVLLAARDAETLQAAAEEVSVERVTAHQKLLWQTADISKPDDVQRLVEHSEASFGRLDILVANAAVLGPLGPVDEVPWDEWRQAVEIDLLGTVLCCRAALPIMKRQRSGKIVVLSGGGATRPQPGMSAYAVSKAAVVRFVETLAQEVQGSGIEVNAVAPGALNTRLLDQVIAAGPERVGGEAHAGAISQQAKGGTSLEHAAELVAFLASSESDGISGRLLSAVWDDWRDLPAQRDRLAGSDVYTLRRIVPEDRWGK